MPNVKEQQTPFNADKAFRQISEAISAIEGRYTPGGLEWARHSRPALYKKVTAAISGMEKAYTAEQHVAVLRAIDAFNAAVERLNNEFNREIAGRQFARRSMPVAQAAFA